MTTAKKKSSQSYSVEIGGILLELRSGSPVSAEVFVDGFKLPEMFTLHHQTHRRKLHPDGGPSDAQKDKYLRTVAHYLTQHPEVLQ
jgi:hypothetical protein